MDGCSCACNQSRSSHLKLLLCNCPLSYSIMDVPKPAFGDFCTSQNSASAAAAMKRQESEWKRQERCLPIAAKLNWTKEPTIAVFGADNNCSSYYNHQSFVHNNKPTSHFFSTIHWWYQRYWSQPFQQHQLTAGCELFTDDFLPNKPRFM